MGDFLRNKGTLKKLKKQGVVFYQMGEIDAESVELGLVDGKLGVKNFLVALAAAGIFFRWQTGGGEDFAGQVNVAGVLGFILRSVFAGVGSLPPDVIVAVAVGRMGVPSRSRI